MRPWLAAFTLVQDGYARAGLRAENSLEAFLLKLAVRDRKPVGALETPKEQILAMASLTRDDQEAFLKNTLETLGSLESDTQALRAAWVAGNLSKMAGALEGNRPGMGSGFNDRVIGARNRKWVNELKSISARGGVSMIVVGIEHLMSKEHALPVLLELQGFVVHGPSGDHPKR